MNSIWAHLYVECEKQNKQKETHKYREQTSGEKEGGRSNMG